MKARWPCRWWFYGYSTPVLPDYPHCGVWNDAYVCGTNEGSQAGTEIYAFDRANMLNGATARPAQRFNSIPTLPGYGFQIVTPDIGASRTGEAMLYGPMRVPRGRPSRGRAANRPRVYGCARRANARSRSCRAR